MQSEQISYLAQQVKHNIGNKTISTAESCTGGLLASYLTEISGSSNYFLGGAVSYSNQSKIKLLNISPADLKLYGAVSKEVACQMAQGCIKTFGSDIAVSITGIAGPKSDDSHKPVGLVFLSIITDSFDKTIQMNFTGSRQQIRQQACHKALEMIVSLLT